jgi:hypothetical protein
MTDVTRFLDEEKMAAFPTEAFTGQKPFPYFTFPQLLTLEGFEALYTQFPPLEKFDKHVGMERAHGQRPHDRYYLAYETSIYDTMARAGGTDGAGEIKHGDLPAPWQGFLEELKTSAPYHRFIERLLGVEPLAARYAWHVGITGSEVSPHRDADNKIGTHIFYFNTSEDWDPQWGGSTLVLGGKKVPALNPDFSDFEGEIAAEIRDNHSFLFKNTPDAWHGVRTLTSPPGRYRRLFNVIFQEPTAAEKRSGGWGARLKKVFGG